MSFPPGSTELNYATGAMPYWDKATSTILQWTSSGPLPGMGWLSRLDDTSNAFNNLQLDMAWLNKANTDWEYLYELSSGQYFADIGEERTQPLTPECSLALIQATVPLPDTVDFWWGTTQFAKLGVFAWCESFAGGITANVSGNNFVNFLNQVQEAAPNAYSAFYVAPNPSLVVLNITTYALIDVPPITIDGTTYNIPN